MGFLDSSDSAFPILFPISSDDDSKMCYDTRGMFWFYLSFDVDHSQFKSLTTGEAARLKEITSNQSIT